MNEFHFNEHKQDTCKCDWLICHIISITMHLNSQLLLLAELEIIYATKISLNRVNMMNDER